MRTVYVTSYSHMDYWHGINQPKDIAELVREDVVPCSIKGAAFAFKMAGWEGKGFIEALWIPPFMFPDPDCYGVHIWHVKQSTCGKSWLCATRPYEFPAFGKYHRWKQVEVDEPPRDPEPLPFTGQSTRPRT